MSWYERWGCHSSQDTEFFFIVYTDDDHYIPIRKQAKAVQSCSSELFGQLLKPGDRISFWRSLSGNRKGDSYGQGSNSPKLSVC
jgi:hypothetical protein